MSNLTRLHNMLTPGTVLTCLENTFRPQRDGAIQTVLNRYGNQANCADKHGTPVTVYLPVRKRDVEWIDEATARWPLDHSGPLAEHSVTYAIETPMGVLT